MTEPEFCPECGAGRSADGRYRLPIGGMCSVGECPACLLRLQQRADAIGREMAQPNEVSDAGD